MSKIKKKIIIGEIPNIYVISLREILYAFKRKSFFFKAANFISINFYINDEIIICINNNFYVGMRKFI